MTTWRRLSPQIPRRCTVFPYSEFRGTRVPVETLFEYLEGGDTLEDFLKGFPTVPRALALEALEEAKQLLLARG
jgi:uncharacterized protein (DUF433 family)